jgi:methionine sulfoxide reductase heme-binding subunit
MKLKKYLELIIYYILPVILLILTATLNNKNLFAKFGQIALITVVLILFLKPVAKISNIKKLKYLLIYRRQFGIASFWFFAFHAFGMWQRIKGYADLDLYLNPKVNILYGLIAAVGMIILTITSNDFAIKKLKTNWKRIQYIAYPVLFLALYHAALAEDEISRFYIISGLFILLKILEWSKIGLKKRIEEK